MFIASATAYTPAASRAKAATVAPIGLAASTALKVPASIVASFVAIAETPIAAPYATKAPAAMAKNGTNSWKLSSTLLMIGDTAWNALISPTSIAALNLSNRAATVSLFLAACVRASCVPVTPSVNDLILSTPLSRMPAVAAFSAPNSLDSAAAFSASVPSLLKPPCSFSSAGARPCVVRVSPRSLYDSPTDCRIFACSAPPSISLPITLRRPIPASDPTLPPTASCWMAAFVSSNDRFAPLAATPACRMASATCGISAAPTLADAAKTLMNRPDSCASFAGSDASTPNCSIELDSASTDAFASRPAALPKTLTDSATVLRASGVFARSGPNFESTVWKASS